jgi:hypothetical protein
VDDHDSFGVHCVQSLMETAADAQDVPGTIAYEAFAKVAEQLSGELDRSQVHLALTRTKPLPFYM